MLHVRTLLAVGVSLALSVGCAKDRPVTAQAEVDPAHVFTAEERAMVKTVGLLTVPPVPGATGKVDASRTIAAAVSKDLKDNGFTVFTVTVPREPGGHVDYKALGRNVDAYLDVCVTEAGYKAHGSKWGQDRDFRPSLSVPVKLVCAKTGATLYTFSVTAGDADRRGEASVRFATEPKYTFRNERELARFGGYADEGLKATTELAGCKVACELGDASASTSVATINE